MASRSRSLLAVATAATLAACGDAPTQLDQGAYAIEMVGGDGQRGLPGWLLDSALTVRVTTGEGAPAPGVPVTFAVEAGSGAVGSTRVSDAAGLAEAVWTFGDPNASTHRVRASVAGGASVTFEATAFTDHEADVVIVHGALGPLRGAALVRVSSSLEVVNRALVEDTMFRVPPIGAVARDLIVFGHGNRPLWAAPSWTSGVDTMRVTLESPVILDLAVDVQAVDFLFMSQMVAEQIVAANSVFESEAVGVRIGSVEYVDHSGSATSITSAACAGRALSPEIVVTVVVNIDGGAISGLGCPSGHVFLSRYAFRFPYLLAHELGHTFSLQHTAVGVMRPLPGTTVTEGEIFRAHFNASSVLNTILGSQPEASRLNCNLGVCLPVAFDLDGS